jgi:hypothetical protein
MSKPGFGKKDKAPRRVRLLLQDRARPNPPLSSAPLRKLLMAAMTWLPKAMPAIWKS